MRLERHLAVLRANLRLSFLLAMQYRWEFLLDGAMSLLWTAAAIVPLYLVFEERPRIAGWTYAMDAARGLTAGAVDAGEKPSVASAIVKCYLTEAMRSVISPIRA